MAKEKITPLVVLGGIIILILLWNAGFFDQIQNNAIDIKDNVVDIAPDILNAGNTICNLNEIVLSEINTAIIDDSMLNWSRGNLNAILYHWNMTQSVQTCEVVFMNELLEDNEIHSNWKNKLGIKNSLKGQVCTIMQCVEEKDWMTYLTTDEYDGRG